MNWLGLDKSNKKCREYDGNWSREYVQINPKNEYWIFGDNAHEYRNRRRKNDYSKRSGQAEIRNLFDSDNKRISYGIPAKEAPRWDKNAFWYDEDFEARNKAIIDEAIAEIPRDKPWVISSGGIGTKRARTPPHFGTNKKTTEYIRQRLLSICTGD